MTEPAPRFIKLRPGQACHPNAGELRLIEPGKELIEMVEHRAAQGEKRIERNVNRLCAADHQRLYVNSIVREVSFRHSLLSES